MQINTEGKIAIAKKNKVILIDPKTWKEEEIKIE